MRTTKRSKLFKSILSLALAAALAVPMGLCASAATTDTDDSGTGAVNGSVEIDGNIVPLTISVTHPTVVTYTINANNDTFVADPIGVTNNTTVPVNVSVESLKSTTGGTLQFTDVEPAAEDWANLDTADTKKYIALGVGITDSTGWNTGYDTDTDWSADNAAVTFGTLASTKTGNLALTAKYGLAWDNTYTAKHELDFLFNLA